MRTASKDPKIRAARMTGTGGGSDALRVDRMRLQAAALELRRRGYQIREIADELALPVSATAALLQAALEAAQRFHNGAAAHALVLELERLDECWRCLERGRAVGDPRSVDVSLRVINTRAALLGLDKVKVEHSGPDGGPIQMAHVILVPSQCGTVDDWRAKVASEQAKVTAERSRINARLGLEIEAVAEAVAEVAEGAG